jgi:hypothetical protein
MSVRADMIMSEYDDEIRRQDESSQVILMSTKTLSKIMKNFRIQTPLSLNDRPID